MKDKRPLVEVLPLAERLAAELRPHCVRLEIAGSLRRRRPFVADIELVAIPLIRVVAPALATDLFGNAPTAQLQRVNVLWEHLEATVPAERQLKWGPKYRQFLHEGIQVDLFTAEESNWGWIFLVRTGSADFSHWMASKLNVAGYTSQDGIIRRRCGTTGIVRTPEEKDVFGLARVPWRAPEERSS